MLPLYLARIGDLGRGDLLKVTCEACDHAALLTPEALVVRLGGDRGAKVLDLEDRLRGRGGGGGGQGGVASGWRRGGWGGSGREGGRSQAHIPPMHLDLTDEETAALATLLTARAQAPRRVLRCRSPGATEE